LLVAELVAPRELRLSEQSIPDPAPGEVQVRVGAVGICGSDLHSYSEGGIGDSPCVYPMVLGHEPAGTVVKSGAGVTGWAAGMRAALEPAIYCYHCEFCRSGRHNICANIRFLSNPGIPGFFREFVNLPAANLLPKSDGLKSPLMCLSQARYGISWGAIGAAMACYDTALQYAKQRKQFRNEPIAGHQLVQEKLTWMITEISKAQLLALQVGRLKDKGKAGFQHISMAKKNNVWMALECARLARDILGANGVSDDYPIMRHMMNLESVKTYEGTHDIHTLIIGQSITGISAF